MENRELDQVIAAIKSYPITVPLKAGHKAKVFELRDFIDSLEVETEGIVYKFQPYQKYYDLVNNQFKKTTKYELDRKLEYVLTALVSTVERHKGWNS